MTAPVVTGLRARGPKRVAVDLDGVPWRVVPSSAVAAAGIFVGGELDRPSVRALRREIRRVEGMSRALQALRGRDHTTASLDRRLATRGTVTSVRSDVVEAVVRAGLVDDERFAFGRAELLAERGAGDLLISDDLERNDVSPTLILAAIAALEPEAARAAVIVERRGRSAKTARYLAAKGFGEGAVEALVAELDADAIG